MALPVLKVPHSKHRMAWPAADSACPLPPAAQTPVPSVAAHEQWGPPLSTAFTYRRPTCPRSVAVPRSSQVALGASLCTKLHRHREAACSPACGPQGIDGRAHPRKAAWNAPKGTACFRSVVTCAVDSSPGARSPRTLPTFLLGTMALLSPPQSPPGLFCSPLPSSARDPAGESLTTSALLPPGARPLSRAAGRPAHQGALHL